MSESMQSLSFLITRYPSDAPTECLESCTESHLVLTLHEKLLQPFKVQRRQLRSPLEDFLVLSFPWLRLLVLLQYRALLSLIVDLDA